ncbi:helix-turn-helix domain-containing protein [Spirillospora sp. CA-294931]|uniref:helix-turn-helix domain-containing protein n=1 Tax=Spirillospora sp. CA-294931 TaxID=3240042 RepID=UPI003D91AAC5
MAPSAVSPVLREHSFDEALRTAIRTRGLSLERLHDRLAERGIRVSLASLSNWQRGQCRPEGTRSLEAVRALEEILGLPGASLVARLGPPRPRGRWGRALPDVLPYDQLTSAHDGVGRLLAEIEGPADERLEWLSCHERFEVGPDRTERAVHTRIVFRALEDGADRHIALHHAEMGLLPDRHRSSYCRTGRRRSDPEAGLTAMELLFERPLERGETCVVEYEFGYAEAGPPTTFWQRWFQVPLREYVLQVRFDPAALPARVYRIWQPNLSTPASDVQELRVTSWDMVHLAEPDLRPGTHGIRWEWD